MHMASKALFGGALMTAGVVNAQSFNFLDSGVGGAYPSFAYLNDTRSGESSIAYAPASLSIGLTTVNGGTLSTTQSSNELRIDGVWDGTDTGGFGNLYAGGRLQQFFTITADAVLRITWDTSSTDGFTQSFVINNADGSVLFSYDGLGGDPVTGSVDVPLVAGPEYGAVLAFDNLGFNAFFEVPNVPAFISMELIPAPSSLALVGLGGLAAARRRR
ncbi:MAG: PEP-CTERM sorting domain-containing protein [Phycisphaerales bacterium]